MTDVVLLPSPFLPGVAYAPLVGALRDLGWAATVASPGDRLGAPGPVLAAYRSCIQRHRPGVVLAHSNAGRYAVAAAGGAPVVYLDAALPPAEGEDTLAPEALLDHLATVADADGLLPAWTRWWPEEDIEAVLPDPEVLAAIRAVEPRIPLSYVRDRLGAPGAWQDAPQAYLALGATYADELALARRLGWPTRVIEGALHLHHLVEPEVVAAELVALAGRLGVG